MPRLVNKISRRIVRQCVVCGKNINVIVYTNGKYRNGHYFGKIPLHTKKALKEVGRAGTHEVKMGGSIWNIWKIMNKDPKPYKYAEYWECAKCYWK